MMKNLKRSDFEIMAPAGSREALVAAINAGADSVYFGIKDLNMRSRSSANFMIEDLEDITSLCKAHGVKTYLTLNILIYDEDIPQVEEILDACHATGVTAVIAADPAVIELAHEKGVAIHISTQCNVGNVMAVRHYAKYADVMVLARELSLDQVGKISERIEDERITGPSGENIRIEMFCHGALCLAVSGKCYLSQHIAGQSANRGACRQICRRGYEVTDLETGDSLRIDNQYIMSPKDLKTIHFLDRMVDAGVKVFKIEGRARGPEYVATTVRCYREALDAILDGTYSEDKVKEWDKELEKIFNRGYWEGYYAGKPLGEWSGKYGSSATRTKFYCAKALRYYPKLGVGEFLLQSGELTPGEEVLIIGPNTGVLEFNVEQLRLDRDPEPSVKKGDIFSMPVPSRIRPGDKLYKWVNTKHKEPDR